VLSIVIPTHNRPDLVRRAVKSALATTDDDTEIIIVDDASSPPAAIALDDLVMANSRVKIIRNTGQRGAAGARNFGVAAAGGDIILFLDDDDALLPGYPGRVMDAAERSEAGFGFSAVRVRSDNRAIETTEGRAYPTGRLPLDAPLRHRITALSAGFWISRHLFVDVGGFPTDQVVDEDTGLCCALAVRRVAPWYDADPGVVVYRGHSPATSASAQLTRSTRDEVVTACYLRTWQRYEREFPTYSEARWFLGTRYLRRALKAGRRPEAWAMVRAVHPAPFAAALAAFCGWKSLVERLRGTGSA
jgi:glycosyltransferase involved in cell wall biosynthesis